MTEPKFPEQAQPLAHATRAARMQHTLEQAFPGARVQVIDESGLHAGHAGANAAGMGSHFRVRIEAPQMRALSRVAQHRLVYDALRLYVEDEGVHALAIEAKADIPPQGRSIP